MKFSPIPNLLLCTLIPLATHAADFSSENKYDVVAKTITPLLGIFAEDAKNGNRAFRVGLRLEQMTNMPGKLAGAKAELAVEFPDKLRISAPVLGQTLTVCRLGHDLWVTPGTKFRELLERKEVAQALPPPDPEAELTPFSLPVPEKDLVFLPALLRLNDVGEQELDGVSCRVIDASLMPELEKSLDATARWVARLWIRPDYKFARITVARPGWNIVLRVDETVLAKSLPAETWKPRPDQADDVMQIDVQKYSSLLRAIGGFTSEAASKLKKAR